MSPFSFTAANYAEALAIVATARACNATGSITEGSITDAATRYTTQYPTLNFNPNRGTNTFSASGNKNVSWAAVSLAEATKLIVEYYKPEEKFVNVDLGGGRTAKVTEKNIVILETTLPVSVLAELTAAVKTVTGK